MADTRDILTLAEAKNRLRIQDSTYDDELAAYITASSRLLDQWAGPTVQYTVTAEIHDGIVNGCARTEITLHTRPVSAVAQILEYTGTSATTLTQKTIGTSPTEGFFLGSYDPDPSLYSGVVIRTFDDHPYRWEPELGNISVNYTAGRAAGTTYVDARFKHAAAVVLENLWRDREFSISDVGEFDVPRQSFPGFAMPNAVKELLADEVGQHDWVSGGIA